MDAPQTSDLKTQASSGTWLGRNARWVVPLVVVVVGVMLFSTCAGLVLTVMHMVRSSEPHRMAMQRVEAHPVVVDALGTPIEQGALVMGNVRVSGGSGSASLQVPISGPKGKAMVFIEATRTAGVWTLEELTFKVEGADEAYDLLSAEPAPSGRG